MAGKRAFPAWLCAAFALASCGSPPAQAQTWQISTASDGRQMASIRTSGPTGPKRGIAVTCQGSAPMLVLAAAQNGTKARANLELTGTVDGSTLTVPMIWNPQDGAWWAILGDRAALDLLAGASSSVFLAMNGTGLGTVPLTGSSNAIRTALAGCYVPVVAMAGGGGGSGSALVAGYYVSGANKCSDVPWNDGYFTTAEDDDSWLFLQEGTIFDRKEYPKRRITSATSFVDDKTKFTHCPESALDFDARRWPDSQHKPVSGLPIKPGLYRTFRDGKLIPTGEGCDGLAEFLLFEPTRVAMVTEEYILDRNHNPTGKIQRVRKVLSLGRRLHQIGARVYANADGEYDASELSWTGPWLIEAPDKFTVSMGECGEIEFRPVDPRTVPPALLPRW